MRRKHIVMHAFMTVCVLMAVFPLLYILANSVLSPREAQARYTTEITAYTMFDAVNEWHYMDITLLPELPTMRQYIQVFTQTNLYLGLFWNSVLLTLPVLIGTLCVAAPAAYSFTYLRWKHKEKLYFLYILVMLMPMQITLVSNFIFAAWASMNNSYWAIILPGIAAPFGVFLLRQELKGLPYDYIEAARIDGASHLRIFLHVVLPMMKASMAAMLMLIFVDYWNLVDQAVVFIASPLRQPLSVYLATTVQTDIGVYFAVACFYTFPAILLFLYGQAYLVQGIQLSGVKM